MSKFQKTILKLGTYGSPDGTVEVTPERLKHWEAEVSRLQEAGYAIPMHWDHSDDPELLEPIAMSVLEKREARSAQNTVGRLHSFKASEDLTYAEIEIEPLTEAAKEKVSTNAVYVSPVISKSWIDGQKQAYQDVITSLDLVDHPVDSSQTAFVAVGEKEVVTMSLRTAESKEVFRLSSEKSGSDGRTDKLSQVVTALADLDIVLPDDTTPENFFDRLHTAILTAAAHSGVSTEDTDMSRIKEESPAIATMSLEMKQLKEQLQASNERELARHKESLIQRLGLVRDSGRCTPVEHDQQIALLDKVKLSLNSEGVAGETAVDHWIAARESLPAGATWDGDEKIKRMGLKEEEAPGQRNFGSDELTPEKEKEAVDALM